MKYIKEYESVDKYKKYVIVKRTEGKSSFRPTLEDTEFILINVIAHSFLNDDDTVLYNARFVKSYKDNEASKMYQYKHAVIYPDDIILYETDNLNDGLKELKLINDTEQKVNKFNI
jgi:hypothetical protein